MDGPPWASNGCRAIVDPPSAGGNRASCGGPRLSQAIQGAAQKLGLATASLPSGAGHDAQSMAKITEAAMVFVPSVDGVSHAPLEYSDPQACVNGANVLLHTLLALDETLD